MRARLGPIIGVGVISMVLLVLVGNVVATGVTTGKVNLGAVTFTTRRLSAEGGGCDEGTPGSSDGGILNGAGGVHWAALTLPSGATVTRLTYAVRDNSELNSTASLVRKYTTNGASETNVFGDPPVMATATSTGAAPTLRRFEDTTIEQATINNGSFAYMARIVSCDTTIEPVSVIIEYTTP